MPGLHFDSFGLIRFKPRIVPGFNNKNKQANANDQEP